MATKTARVRKPTKKESRAGKRAKRGRVTQIKLRHAIRKEGDTWSPVFPAPAARSAPTLPVGADETLRTTFLARSKTLLEQMAAKAPAHALAAALRASSNVGGLATLLTTMIGDALRVESIDPLAKAIARGAAAKETLLADAGGVFGVGQVAKLLGITRQAVEKRRRSNNLLAVPSGTGDHLYPTIQFTTDGVVPGLRKVLRAFPGEVGTWTRLDVLLGQPDQLNRRLIDAVREGKIDDAVRVATSYGEHGA